MRRSNIKEAAHRRAGKEIQGNNGSTANRHCSGSRTCANMQIFQQQLPRYAGGILAALVALLLRGLLNPVLGYDNPYHTAWLAVVFSAWFCGIGPSIACVIISVIGVWYWFLAPVHSFGGKTEIQFFGVVGFLAVSVIIMLLGKSGRRVIVKLRRAENELLATQRELEQKVRDRTAALGQRTIVLEQKTAELAEKAAMLDLANDAIFVRSASDTISYWNEGAERLYGWTRQEALGRSPHDLLHTEFPTPLVDIKRKEVWEGELLHSKRDGTIITVASRWRTLRDVSGKPMGWLEINTDITLRRQAEEAARSLSGRILTLQDEERRRIARELHDSLGQYLAALKMNLESLPTSKIDQPRIISECSSILEQCLIETRTISHLLHPPLLDESGLGSAIRWYVDEFARRSGIAVNFQISQDLLRLSSDVEIALFRAVQEGLTNVHRHSGASSVEILLALDKKQVRLEIRDNGRGIPQERMICLMEGASGFGVGLAGLRERVSQLGGSVQIQSDASGTRLSVTTPLVDERQSDPPGFVGTTPAAVAVPPHQA